MPHPGSQLGDKVSQRVEIVTVARDRAGGGGKIKIDVKKSKLIHPYTHTSMYSYTSIHPSPQAPVDLSSIAARTLSKGGSCSSSGSGARHSAGWMPRASLWGVMYWASKKYELLAKCHCMEV